MTNIALTNEYLPSPQEMEMIMKYCELVAKAPSYAAMGGLPGVFAVVMTARELGIGPMSALNGGMHLIPNLDKEGKPKGPPQIMMAARTMNMMILKNGHKIEEIENVPGKVTLKGTRADNGVSMTVTMTIDMAKAAGLSHDMYGKPKMWSAWFKTMDDMLWKTCVSKLGRRLFADVIGNAYEPAEFEEKESKETLDVKPEKKKLAGKNIPSVLEVQQPAPQIEFVDPDMTFQEFLETYRIADNCAVQDQDMIAYIKSNAEKRNKSYDEMLQYCHQNKKGFLEAYRMYAVKEGIDFIESNASE